MLAIRDSEMSRTQCCTCGSTVGVEFGRADGSETHRAFCTSCAAIDSIFEGPIGEILDGDEGHLRLLAAQDTRPDVACWAKQRLARTRLDA